MIKKQKWLFWSAGFFSANQGFLKTFQIVLFEWIKPALQKSHFCFDHVNKLKITVYIERDRSLAAFAKEWSK